MPGSGCRVPKWRRLSTRLAHDRLLEVILLRSPSVDSIVLCGLRRGYGYERQHHSTPTDDLYHWRNRFRIVGDRPCAGEQWRHASRERERKLHVRESDHQRQRICSVDCYAAIESCADV